VSNEQLATAYFGATSASVLTALGLNKLISSTPALSGGIIGRFVPLLAVAAANFVNIPLMRQQELKKGITIETPTGNQQCNRSKSYGVIGEAAGLSGNAAQAAILQVVPSRVGMAAPAMFIPPLVMSRLEKTASFIKNPWLKAPATVIV